MNTQIYLDYSMFSQFWRNPEEFRLGAPFLLNLRPKVTKEYFGVGGFVHLMQEAKHKGWSEARIAKEVADKKLEPFAEYGMFLWNELDSWNQNFSATILNSEETWSLALSERFGMFGKIDEIWDVHGAVEVQDTKTMGERWSAKEAITEVQLEWENTIIGAQANFGLIGAKVIGYVPERFRVKVVCKINEKEPCYCGKKRCKHPKIMHPRPKVFTAVIKRDEQFLNTFKRDVLMTCSLIDHWINDFGFEKPWPHIVAGKWAGYVCGGRAKKADCSYASICGKDCSLMGEYLQWFEQNDFYEKYFKEEVE